MKKTLFFFFIRFMILWFLFILNPTNVFAFEFNPNYIISDNDATNYRDMSRRNIEKFLKDKGSSLYFYEALTKDGDIQTAAQVIHSACTRWKISKRFMLVLLQKEQSLITDPSPKQKQYDWATGYAVCDSCVLDDPKIQRWKGFAQQVNSAAAQFRDYFDNSRQYSMKMGEPIDIDGTIIIPENQATTNMYLYTPHIEGNKNFARIWNDWFGESTDKETRNPLLPYPDGALLQIEGDETVWYVREGARQKISTLSVLVSRFDKKKILKAKREDVEKYPIGKPLKFHQYALVSDETGNIYLIVNDKKRHIESLEIFQNIGYNLEEVIDATKSDLEAYITDIPITQNTVYPAGKLFQNIKTGDIFYVESNVKYPIVDRRLLNLRFKGREVTAIDATELSLFLTANPYPLADGELVRTRKDPTVYVISQGKRRKIDKKVMRKLGYNPKNVIKISQKLLEAHPLGEEITPQ